MASSAGTDSGPGSGSPCGACKFLRRKCVSDCIFAPYFRCEDGAARFASIHKVFGASNVSKLLLHVPVQDRCEAVVTIAYEAQARIRDPVYGCVAHIFALQHQVAILQAQVMQARAQLAHGTVGSRVLSVVDQWQGNIEANPNLQQQSYSSWQSAMSPSSSLGSSFDGMSVQEMYCNEELPTQAFMKRRSAPHNELGELQALALKMMRN